MDAFPDPTAPLPDDVPTLHALVRQLLQVVQELRADNARLHAENAELRAKLDTQLRHRFGRRSERQRPSPRPRTTPPKVTPHGRSPLPDHLERRDVVHDLLPAERLCPACGHARHPIGQQVTEQLDWEPARCFVRRTIKKTYACRHCDPAVVPAEHRLQTAGPTQVGPLAKALCGPGLLAHVLTAKFADHVPLHRLVGQVARTGVRLAEATVGDWVARAADLLEPLVQLMHQRVLRSRVLHSDDTSVKLRVAGAARTTKAHLWVYLGDADYPYVLYDFTADYTAAGPTRFLAGYRGYLQADALAQYEGLYAADTVQHVCCLAHARRKFVPLAEATPPDPAAQQVVAWFGQLYALERALPPLLPPTDDPAGQAARQTREVERQRLRATHATPLLQELKAWLDAPPTVVLPKSPLGQAVNYCRNHWPALTRYLEQGYLAIDNNASERLLRAVAVGRNNWGQMGSVTGGQTAAVLYSVVQTCQHLGIDPFRYLRAALPGLFALGESPTAEQLTPWLPDRWLLAQTRAGPAQAIAG